MPSLKSFTLIALLSILAFDTLSHPVAAGKRLSPKKRQCARPTKTASVSLSSLTMPMATGTVTEEDGTMSILPVGNLSTAISDDAPTPVGNAAVVSETLSASVIGNQLVRTGGWTGRRGSRTRTTASGAQSTSAAVPSATSAPVPAPIPTTESLPDDLETFPSIIPDEPTASIPVEPTPSMITSQAGSSVVATSASASASASAATSAGTTPPATGSGGKARAGLAINGESGSNWSAWTGGNVDWLYNWGSSKPANLPSSIEYVPMLWGTDTSAFLRDLPSFSSWGVNSVLSFNEPDMGSDVGGSRITAAEAAKIHQQVFTEEVHKNFRIGGPSVARGGKGWLAEFEAACGGNCIYDFLPIHFYGKDASQFAPYLQEMLAAGNNKPLWITEVACIEFGSSTYYCNEQENEAFMKQIIKDMNDPINKVERHSWFGAFLNTASSGQAFGIMNTDGSPNALGKIYMTAS